MLRFNGQSPIQANGAFSAFPGRMIGTVAGTNLQTGMQPLWGVRRASTASFGVLSGIVGGTTHPVSWLMALRAGRIQSPANLITFSTSNTVIPGLPASGSVSITFVVGPSQLELIVSAAGSVSIAFSLNGSAAAVLSAEGTIGLSFTVGPATLGAEAGLFGSTTFTFDAAAIPRATGNMEGAVTPFTPLSPQSLAAAVWDTLLADHLGVGSTGYALNNISAGSTPEQIADAVWNKVLP